MGDTNLAAPPPTAPRAFRVGSDLRAARERLGWSLADTAAYTRIRLPLLTALEDGRVGDLPGPVFATGFVRSYAAALGVDADEMVRRYAEETGDFNKRVKLDFPAPVPQRHVPAGAVVLLGALLAFVGYAGWYRSTAEHGGLAPVQQVPARLAPLALPVVPPPPARIAAAQTPTPLAAATVVPSAASPSAAEASVPSPGSLAPVMPAPTPAGRLVLSATADAWVQVKDSSGKVVMSKLMHQGDSWAVPDQPAGGAPMLLTTGNAGGTVLTLDGQALPALGDPGAVRRDVALDPATLKNG